MNCPNFKRYLIGISYNGTKFYGFQEQKGQNVKTVEGVLKEYLKPFLAEKIGWISMSRTDKGVSAKINYIAANFKENINNEIIKNINEKLKKEGIEIVHFERVPLNFTVRGICKFKEYKYFLPKSGEVWIFNGEKNIKKKFEDLKLDLKKFNDLKKIFKGEKNVINFSKYDKDKKYSYKTNFIEIEMEDKEEKIEFTIKGDKFYWEEVRRLINIFISYMSGYLTKEDLLKLFKEKSEKKPKAYPAENLILWNVEFDI